MAKRKTSALRETERDTRYTQQKKSSQTFYDSKTINFNQTKIKPVKKNIELIPKSKNQEKFIVSLMDDNIDIVVVSGPAGTGKTYLSVLAAIKSLKDGKCERIVLTRPAVSVENENHGFLPGDLNEKMEPWVKPLFDVFREHYSVQEITQMLEDEIIEICPLGFMRGRSLKKCFILADEMQNATPAMYKMLMTRIGEGSKLVIDGDTEQGDRKSKDNGLLDLQERLRKNNVPGLSLCHFELSDVQRHKIIEHIIKLYG